MALGKFGFTAFDPTDPRHIAEIKQILKDEGVPFPTKENIEKRKRRIASEEESCKKIFS